MEAKLVAVLTLSSTTMRCTLHCILFCTVKCWSCLNTSICYDFCSYVETHTIIWVS